jgi:hypothetical protein
LWVPIVAVVVIVTGWRIAVIARRGLVVTLNRVGALLLSLRFTEASTHLSCSQACLARKSMRLEAGSKGDHSNFMCVLAKWLIFPRVADL